MEVTVKDRQSLLDIAVQTLGGVEGVFALAERNGVGITDRLEDGTVLQWEYDDTADSTVQTFYSDRGLTPATEITDAELRALLGEIEEETAEEEEEITFEQNDSGSLPSLTRIFTDEFERVFA
ncbi:MAG: hypothetical protein LUC33_04535 [Prevotellaceae bacterium]|nr:hypothetical protein [Prevotellaceae bacterium]